MALPIKLNLLMAVSSAKDCQCKMELIHLNKNFQNEAYWRLASESTPLPLITEMDMALMFPIDYYCQGKTELLYRR